MMAREFRESANRPPTAAELSGLIDRYVRDEIIYREGVALGLDRDDAVIRRRIRQKYDLIAEEQDRALPTDEELSAYLSAHPETFIRPALVSFDQIFFEPAPDTPQRVAIAKAALSGGEDGSKFGDPSLLPNNVRQTSVKLVANDFGDRFVDQVRTAPLGKWIGPVESSFGVHLLRVSDRSNALLPRLEDVRAEVLREWDNDRRTRSREEDYRRLRDDYEVVVTARLPTTVGR